MINSGTEFFSYLFLLKYFSLSQCSKPGAGLYSCTAIFLILCMASGHAYSNPALKTEGLISPWDFPQVASVNHLSESFSATVREGEVTLDCLELLAWLTARCLKAS